MDGQNTQFSSQAAEIVAQFINSTASHVFLTGKAGTGKTTFLKNLAHKTHKNFIVVAPTGIAALNAGGVTIHSQFLFPLGMFLPDRNIPGTLNGQENFYTSDMLARKHPLNSQRKQVLRSIDLLVIDEVSMLRADLLDAIDYRLKAARGNFRQSFGGIQLLLIGDLFQLPPVVSKNEESLMARYYASAWFFEAKSLMANPPAYIELDKIYRQHDEKFIEMLNRLRNNVATPEVIAQLNSYYKSEVEIQNLKEIITLTTHNYKADEINQRTLRALPAAASTFEAKIEGEFPESMFPVLKSLVLKVGAQIMFVKNDAEEKKYFNGKLATVRNLTNDEVMVEMAETHVSYTLKKVRWVNKKYTLNPERQDLEEEELGAFEQYPVKLAWAITVHKSQGLTFERAVVDVGQAFADGQVYVALSRLRSLEGLVLRSHINPEVISTDKRIVSYSEINHKPETLIARMRTEQPVFLQQLLAKAFDFNAISKEIEWYGKNKEEDFIASEMKPVPIQINEGLKAEHNNTEKFIQQLKGLWHDSNLENLLERVEKGSAYYKAHITGLLKILLAHIRDVRQQKRVKAYLNHLTELDQMLQKKLEEFDKVLFLVRALVRQTNDYDFTTTHKQMLEARSLLMQEVKAMPLAAGGAPKRKKKTKKDADGRSTYDITLEMINQGLSPEAIAKERGLAVSTIETHLGVVVGQGRLQIQKFISEADLNEIIMAQSTLPANHSSKELYEKLNGKFSYGKLRAVMFYASAQKE